MTTVRSIALLAVPALAGAALFTAAPASALDASDSQAVAQCRADLFGRFAPGAIRSHRIGEIAGNSRRTRVTIYASADRRYTFECATGADGRVQSASLNPPANTRLAGAPAGNQAQ